MKILISNDDGVYAPGLKTLASFLNSEAEVTVVAPDRNRSASSNSLTIEYPIRVNTLDNGFHAINGTPTDCVHLAITGWLEEKPDMVISGINAGSNVGDDVIYSGTVAAAMEGRFLGLPAIAVSLARKIKNSNETLKHYDTAAIIVASVVKLLKVKPLPEDTILNINVPDLPLAKIKGIKVTRLGHRHITEGMVRSLDARGKEVFWVGPPGAEDDAGEGTDFAAVRESYVSITPLQVDLTKHEQIQDLSSWLQQINLNT